MDKVTYTNNIIISFGLVVLLAFSFMRPIFIGLPRLESINLLDIFAISISFLILLVIIININKIDFDFLSISIILYSLLCIFSILSGSDVRSAFKFTLPFLLFFFVRIVINNEEQLHLVFKALILGYSYLILASAIGIITGHLDVAKTMYYSDVERFQGVANQIHTFAHSMVFFSFIFAYYLTLNNHKNKFFKIFTYILFIFSIYCLIMTYTRTCIVGLIIFWTLYLFFNNKKILIFLLIIFLPLSIIFADNLKRIFWQVKETEIHKVDKVDLDHASSGRLYLWKTNLDILSKSDTINKLLGLGIGRDMIDIRYPVPHNDFLSILMSTGIIGIIMYFIILVCTFIKIISINNKKFYFFISFFISVFIMMNLSLSYIGRFEMTQLYWFIIGLIYLETGNNNIDKEYE